MSKQPPPAPIASAIGPCPTIIQISRTPQHWKFTQHLRTTRPPPSNDEKLNLILSKVSVNENRFKRLESIFDTVANHQRRISKIESVMKSYDDRIRLLEYKSIDLEARSRRNNILFYGLKENRNED